MNQFDEDFRRRAAEILYGKRPGPPVTARVMIHHHNGGECNRRCEQLYVPLEQMGRIGKIRFKKEYTGEFEEHIYTYPPKQER